MNLLENTPRLRMFTGPNGSGKSTIKSILKPNLLGYYINPDEIEAEINKFDFGHYGIQTDKIVLFSANLSLFSENQQTPFHFSLNLQTLL